VEITVRLFAQQRQLTGWRQCRLALPAGATIDDAWQRLVADVPELAPSRPFVRFARNAVYAETTERLAEGDELAVIPPVAGGSEASGHDADGGGDGARVRYRRLDLRADAIDDALTTELRGTVPTTADGALVVFFGQTRETPGSPAPGQESDAARFTGEQVIGLDYEAFETMALAVMDAICSEIEQRFDVRRLAIVHRTGEVGLGETSVVVAAAAAHRGAAFDACRYAIEELKARAPIWKSERFTSGRVWIGAPARSGPADTPARSGPADAPTRSTDTHAARTAADDAAIEEEDAP
jgi:MoaE-MoaD fusion protein